MANRIYVAGDNLSPTGDVETFEYRRADDPTGEFAADLLQYAQSETGLKVAISQLTLPGVMKAVNKALLVKAQGEASADAGRENRVAAAGIAKDVKRALASTDPAIVAAMKLIGLKK